MMTALDPKAVLENAARRTPAPLARRVRGLSDRALAWLFITPTIALLLAINIFPLLWTIYMSFTNFKANMGWVKYRSVGVDNYVDILTDTDIWTAMQTTAHFVFWSTVNSTGEKPVPALVYVSADYSMHTYPRAHLFCIRVGLMIRRWR